MKHCTIGEHVGYKSGRGKCCGKMPMDGGQTSLLHRIGAVLLRQLVSREPKQDQDPGRVLRI